MGLPSRIAIPVLVAFAVIFLGIMGYLLRIGFGTTGSAFGPGAVAEQGDARIQATPAPIASDPPGTFTVPQTGTGPISGGTALPGASTGGGPPAPVMQQVESLRARLARNPDDVGALVQLGQMEQAANNGAKATQYLDRARAQLDKILAAHPNRSDAVYERAVVLQSLGRRSDAAADYRRFLSLVPADDPRAEDAKAALAQLGA